MSEVLRAGALASAALAAGLAAPALTALGPVRRAVTPRLAGRGDGAHVALTFDDGPDPRSTPAFLDLLARHDRRATFFLLGSQAQAAPDLVRRMVAEGHEVAVHGWTHRCAVTLPPSRVRRELRRARDVLEDLAEAPVRWYRPPYGVASADTFAAAAALGLDPVLWTTWGRDWERAATPERVVAEVVRRLRPGGTVLLHDTDLHGRGHWATAHAATGMLLAGPLRDLAVGPLRDHDLRG